MSERRLMTGATVMLAALVVVSVILGPLITGIIDFRVSENAVDQFRGSEIVSLAVVVPILLGAGLLSWRGHPAAPYLAIAGGLFCIYTYLTVIQGQEYLTQDGNIERAFPLYAAMIGLGTVVSVLAGLLITHRPASTQPARSRAIVRWVLITICVAVGVLWAGQIAGVYRGTVGDAYAEGPALFWLIKLLDYGFIIPVALLLAAGLRVNRPHAFEAATALLCFATVLGIAIGGMIVSTTTADQNSFPMLMTVILIVIAAGLLVLDARLIRQAIRSASADTDHDSTSSSRM